MVDIMTEEIDYTKWEYPETDSEIIEEFNGYVISVEEDSFWIAFTDMQDVDSQMELKMSFLDEDHPEEKLWLNEGQYFRWRFMKNPDDPDEALDEFVFYKRIWSEEEIEEIKKKAEEMCKLLKWE